MLALSFSLYFVASTPFFPLPQSLVPSSLIPSTPCDSRSSWILQLRSQWFAGKSWPDLDMLLWGGLLIQVSKKAHIDYLISVQMSKELRFGAIP
ncbi:uncharacterized protein LOC122075922 isoform X2 [Macadamia integrifolia]|uniref:uncharacterized protein LOC122075922 isoform X2 n=1 Tax=Macadamia integrifolia TaxID=60698 RepID=UPI001C4F60B4|nr:uncharacterized protein LOC122075922 isoform X2 [Macadamia integrifolia]